MLRPRLLPLTVLAFAGLLVAACVEEPGHPTAPLSVAGPSLAPPTGEKSKRPDKVAICHLDDDGVFVLRSIAAPAVPGHLGHGDLFPGDALPDGSTLGEACQIIPPEPDFVSYAFEVELSQAIYTGTDGPISQALPSGGDTLSGTLIYDPDVPGAPNVSPAVGTNYEMTPAGPLGMSLDLGDGLVWETDPAGDFSAWVTDRAAGTGADFIRFRSDQSLTPVAGLTTDHIWLTFFDFTGAVLSDESFPASLELSDFTVARLDFFARDAANQLFRVQGVLTSLTPIP